MKTKLLIILMAALLSGCSIFRKSEKHKLEVKSSVNVEYEVKTNEQTIIVENSDRNKTTVEDSESNTQTTIEADEIILKPDGTIEAKGNAKADQTRKDSNKKKGQESENTSKVTDMNKQTDSNLKVSEKMELDAMDKIPEVAKKPIWNWIGGALFVLIVGAGTILWLRFK